MRLFVFGLGYSARAAIGRLRPRLEAAWGTTRDPGRLEEIERLGVAPLVFDSGALLPSPPFEERVTAQRLGDGFAGAEHLWRPFPNSSSQGAKELVAALEQSDHILVSIAPDGNGDPVLNHFRNQLTALSPKSVVYLSTIGVYGDHNGAWVDETSECRPVSERSRQRVKAEQEWQAFSAESGVPVAIIRLSGIYGAGRGPFEKIRRGTARRIVKQGQVFNRIHVDDIAAIVEAAFLRHAAGPFNGTDDEPAPPQDVLAFAADLLGVPPPPEVAFNTADMTPMARTFYGENKRVRNDRIKRELGVQLAYPTYREGLRAVLEAEGRANEAAVHA